MFFQNLNATGLWSEKNTCSIFDSYETNKKKIKSNFVPWMNKLFTLFLNKPLVILYSHQKYTI